MIRSLVGDVEVAHAEWMLTFSTATAHFHTYSPVGAKLVDFPAATDTVCGLIKALGYPLVHFVTRWLHLLICCTASFPPVLSSPEIPSSSALTTWGFQARRRAEFRLNFTEQGVRSEGFFTRAPVMAVSNAKLFSFLQLGIKCSQYSNDSSESPQHKVKIYSSALSQRKINTSRLLSQTGSCSVICGPTAIFAGLSHPLRICSSDCIWLTVCWNNISCNLLLFHCCKYIHHNIHISMQNPYSQKPHVL